MRVITRHRPDDPGLFLQAAREALLVLDRQSGFLSGELGRSPDDPGLLLLTTRWADVGSMRRGMGAFDARIALAPVMASAEHGASVFEVLLEVRAGEVEDTASDRAPEDLAH